MRDVPFFFLLFWHVFSFVHAVCSAAKPSSQFFGALRLYREQVHVGLLLPERASKPVSDAYRCSMHQPVFG